MRAHKIKAQAEAVSRNKGIRIEEQYIFSATSGQCLVIGFCKTKVPVVLNKTHAREKRLQISEASVSRIIIDHDHLCFNAPNGFPHSIEALFQEIPDIIIYYDDRKFQNSRSKIQGSTNKIQRTGREDGN
jgi:hypothetical protein